MSDDVLGEDGRRIFRPSYSATFLNCAGSLLPSLEAEDNGSWEAAEGTVFHSIMSIWQTEGRPDYMLGTTVSVINKRKDGTEEIWHVIVDEDMFSYGEICLEKYENIVGDVYVETFVDISEITPVPNQGGTADKAICQIGVLDIIDWKYGKGVQVFAFRNTQLLLYALGFFYAYDWIYHFQVIRLHIAQPRFDHWDVWEISREDLLAFAEEARAKMLDCMDPHAARRPGPKQCQWCKVRRTCAGWEAARSDLCDLTFTAMDEPVTYEQQLAIVQRDPPMPQLVNPAELPTETIERILMYRKMMEAWFTDAHETLLARGMQNAGDLTIFKVVPGRSKRAYVDEEEAAERYRRLGLTDDEIYERKIKSPNKMEPELRKIGIRGKLMKAWLKLVAPPQPGRPTLVPAGSARSEIPSIVDQSFEGEDEI